ncbi:GNAT family N-acetyltransferase [Lentzea sp. NBRC 102530]|uniref:GNAT family N-acetyltransferase n=1 Tax=Lentzea sp. NBRC 102530 TaxID=3032201 RepID=UPI0024A19DA1|nr:GNAT family N-acetyltransferase [Lentzea sp. NBRC 102530]GLY53708.1 N-acetyltransferase [Lentzea sp. NBRC 102530]
MEIRRLDVDDIPECMKLITDRGWSWTPEQWEVMLALGPCYGAFDGSGLLGTALTTPYPEIQAISGVLVASRAGRQGIGTQLMSNMLDISPSVLYATAMGQPLYERLGFHPVGQTVAHFGTIDGPAPGVTRKATPADAATLADLDREASGYTRPAFWDLVLAPAGPYEVLVSDDGVVATRPNPTGVTIGPLIASSAAAACSLIADVAAGRGEVRVDTDDADVAAYLTGHGFEARPGGCVLMVRGVENVPGDRSRYFAPASHALG